MPYDKAAPLFPWVLVCRSCGKRRADVDLDPTSFVGKPRIPGGPDDHCPTCREKGPLVVLVEGIAKTREEP